MSRPVKFYWPEMDSEAVCTEQTLAGAGELVIDGTLATKNDAEKRKAIFENIERVVSVTSTANLSGRQFTITGLYRGRLISQTIAGPDNTTVYTTQTFSTVTSVSVNGAAANVSIGTGNKGNTIWYLSDYHRTNSNLMVSVYVADGVVSYSFVTTPDFIDNAPVTFLPISGMTNASTSQIANYTIPTTASMIRINDSDEDVSLEITFLQQGML